MERIDLVIQQLREGDEGAFDQVYNRYSSRVFRVAMAILRTEDEAYEVVQETFLKLWYRREDLDPTRSIEGYLSTLARNFALKIIKKSLRETLLDDLPEVMATDEADDLVNLQDFQQKLQQALGRIPPRSREILLLSRYEGLSNAQIAAKLGLSLSTVNNHIHRALTGLRDHLHVPISLILLLSATHALSFPVGVI